ncbi:MAG: His/Gly/Thr/Pro-type tRNA ligase C-terminal domain-containing protein, partial [Candidatus Bathyarchaeia archaeon]
MEIYRSLKEVGFRVEVDLSDKTPGAKYYYWEMMGVPIRAEVGLREVEAKTVTIFRRDNRSRITVQLDGLVETVKKLGYEALQNIRRKAEEFFELRLFKAETFDEVRDLADKGGFIVAPFCSIDFDGESCSLKLKEILGLEVRGVPLKNRVKPSEEEKCIVCGRKAGEYVYLGKAY